MSEGGNLRKRRDDAVLFEKEVKEVLEANEKSSTDTKESSESEEDTKEDEEMNDGGTVARWVLFGLGISISFIGLLIAFLCILKKKLQTHPDYHRP